MRTLGPLRAPAFRWYFTAQGVNLAGSMMNGVALAFAVLEISHSASALGVVLAARSVPMVAFVLAGGIIADRIGRRLTIQAANLLAGVTQLAIAALALSGSGRLWELVVLSAVNGTANAIGYPALVSLVPQLVPRDELQPANALMRLQRSALSVAGPAVAGILVATTGPGVALAVDGATYLLAALLLIPTRIPPPQRTEPHSPVADLREGWSFFRGTTWLWVVVAGSCLCNALASGTYLTLGPVLAKATSLGESGWGLVLSAHAVGLLVTSAVLLRLPLRRPLLWGTLAIALNGLPMVGLGLSPTLAIGVITAVLAGFGMEVFGLGWDLAMQENVPEEMLSRAYSYDALGSVAAIPVGQLVSGVVAAQLGLRPTLVLAGLGYVLICLVTLLARSVRDLPRAPVAREQVTS